MSKPRKIQEPMSSTVRTLRLAVKIPGAAIERVIKRHFTDNDLEFFLDYIREQGGNARVLAV